jgi:hypothetical protein
MEGRSHTVRCEPGAGILTVHCESVYPTEFFLFFIHRERLQADRRQLITATTMRDVDGVQFLQWCLPKLRLIWPGYRKVRRQVYKRISARLQSLGLHSVADYRPYLEAHPEEWGF